MTLGVFDSGLGGLTVLRALRERSLARAYVYLADQAHVPYGDRDDDDLATLLAENVAHLAVAGVDAIVMGCNTSCAVAARRGWPTSAMPIFDLVAPAADAVAATGARRVGVVATAATARSGAYGDAIRARVPGAIVIETGAPELVPLVEAGTLDGPRAHAAVARSVAAVRDCDVVVLACTHFPLLDAVFAAELAAGVVRVDPAQAQARAVAAFATERAGPMATVRYLTTGALGPFRDAVERLVGFAPGDVVERIGSSAVAAL